MLTEPWTSDFQGNLENCYQTNGKCLLFESMFEAQFFCESLTENCVGVQEVDNQFLAMTDLGSKRKYNAGESLIKEMLFNIQQLLKGSP